MTVILILHIVPDKSVEFPYYILGLCSDPDRIGREYPGGYLDYVEHYCVPEKSAEFSNNALGLFIVPD